MNVPSIQKLLLYVLICVMFIPYVASPLGLGESSIYEVEIVAFVSWYIASLVIPLILKELDTAFILWYITFVLVGVAMGSDMVYHITKITPALWYDSLGRLRSPFYSFVKTWVLLVMPGCVLFVIMVFGRKVYWKSEEVA